MPKKKKFLLIDCNALIHRAFHALPPLRTRKGENIGAVYGFTSTLLKAINDIKPVYIAATFDSRVPTFRHKEYKAYKATRVKAPKELYDQIALTKEVLKGLNIPIFEKDGYEADDLIGTLCKKIDDKKADIDTIIVTGDLDTLQLIDHNTKVYTLKRGIKDTIIYDEDLVEQKYGFSPQQVIDFKALRGDPSDNIPGVKGIGEKTAIDLIKKYKTLDGVYKAVEGPDKKWAFSKAIREKLKKGKKDAYLSYKLATINLEVPIKIDIEKCAFDKIDKDEALAVFQKFEFRSLMSRLLKLLGEESREEKISLFEKGELEIKKPRGVSYVTIDDKKKFHSFLKELKRQKEVALDTETDFLGAIESNIVGISFAWQEKEAFYIPLGHKKGKQLEKNFVLSALKPILEDKKIKKIGHNIKYDILVLLKEKVEIKGVYFDTMVASYILDPARRGHGLDTLAFVEFGYQMIKISDLIGKGKKQVSFAGVNIDDATDYSCEDADITFRLYQIFKKRLSAQGELEKTRKLFYEIEMPLVKILAKMEWWGVKINSQLLKTLSLEVEEKIEKLKKEIYHLAKCEFNISSTQQLGEVLYKKLKISTVEIKKTKTGVSTAAGELEKLKGAHPIIRPILEYRELTKLKNTYLDALPKLISRLDGRVHTSYNQTVTATGRLSSSDPNLQNIPAHGTLGGKIRKAFIAEKDNKLLSFDYSQIELRIVASIANDKKMLEAFKKDRDIHSETAQAIFNLPKSKLSEKHRRVAKIVNFGIIYGISAYGLAQSAEISRERAKEFIDGYFKKFPDIKKYIEETLAFVEKNGYVETLLGRRRYIPDIHSGVVQIKHTAERMAINMPIQGTAADIIKLAMVKIDKEILQKDPSVKMILQVHDELVFEIPKDKITNYQSQITKIMENIFKLKCPLKVDSKVGDNWA